jgi:hypothetical protein
LILLIFIVITLIWHLLQLAINFIKNWWLKFVCDCLNSKELTIWQRYAIMESRWGSLKSPSTLPMLSEEVLLESMVHALPVLCWHYTLLMMTINHNYTIKPTKMNLTSRNLYYWCCVASRKNWFSRQWETSRKNRFIDLFFSLLRIVFYHLQCLIAEFEWVDTIEREVFGVLRCWHVDVDNSSTKWTLRKLIESLDS